MNRAGGVAIALVVACGAGLARADTSTPGAAAPSTWEQTLAGIAEGKLPLGPLTIHFDNEWDQGPRRRGGISLLVRGDGTVAQRPAPAKSSPVRRLSRSQLLELVALLRKHRAWEDRPAAREPVPDEESERLTLSWHKQEVTISELTNDVERNHRLQEIRDRMRALAWAEPPIDLLEKAQEALVIGHYEQTILLAQRGEKQDPGRAWRLRGTASCFMADGAGAQAAYAHVDRTGRSFLLYVCQRNGIDLTRKQPDTKPEPLPVE